ncbi:hypothetical protein [Ligilactobacillus acidipiscis]|uniref:hypothetical protein n=1 Tax=Ligilactobacillus acidipiscis TaxID=89059 RepID=UPI0023F8A741|nr:hypothetical protein [Ligilactobacillus acidipiscis]WEV57434.1 hypothetical protein OZX66_02500 [Ligilactobacillus acidipiscis]
MSDLKIEVTIDGETYTDAQLAQYEYQRDLHVLHELKDLGVRVADGEHELSHQDINWIEPKKAAAISLDIRQNLGADGAYDLFKDVEADTERRWKEYLVDYKPEDSHVGVTKIHVTGVTIPETLPVMGGGHGEKQALSINPEHYIVQGAITNGEQQHGMEVFGMFGEPTYITGEATDEIPAGLPFKKDPHYVKSMFGETLLGSDGTNIHLGAMHEFLPEENGFSMKSTFFCPGKAPQAIADGHKIHFALELTNSMKIAYQLKQ